MAIAGTNITLNATEGEDKITVTEKVTTPYFSNGSTELLAANIVSESLSDTNEKYFFGIAHSSTPTTTEFHVAYGNSEGNGGDDNSNAIKSPTQAIYKQFSNLLLPATEVTGGFFISRNNSLASVPSNAAVASGRDQDIFVMVAERARMKDRLNKKNWTIILSGSNTHGDDGNFIHLTDDSANDTPVSTPAGDRFNIVSGSDGSTFNNVVTFNNDAHKGFVTTANQDNNYKTALRFINCLKDTGAKLKFRDEEDQISTQYFCRAKAGHFNFSNNPTFVSGSQNELRHTSMKGNPTTFITSVQLYNSSGDMVAVGNLSTPLKKNFSTEATIKVKLTY